MGYYCTIYGKTINTTPEYPFLTADGTRVTAADLTVGAELRSGWSCGRGGCD
ncbi:MAG: hypothetical protein R2911_12225 [Caldilineaceae bacterium]